MANFIVGNDISTYQGEVDFTTYKNNTNFLIAKATEGIGKIDDWYGNNRQQARDNAIPFGSYHFARPDLGNSAVDEAKYFCDVIDGDPIKEGEVLALDFEVAYSDPVTWCLDWLNAVSEHYNGIKPLIYLNQSLVNAYDWTPVADAGYGLWLAAWSFDPNTFTGDPLHFPFIAVGQWTDKQTVPGITGEVDGDVFFGDVSQFKEYGYKAPQPVEPETVQAEVVPEESAPSVDEQEQPTETPTDTEPVQPTEPLPTEVTSSNAPLVTQWIDWLETQLKKL